MDFVFEVIFFRLVHHVDAGAFDVELPAVIDAAQPAFLVTAEIEAGEAVRTQLIQQADAALAVPEGHQILAQKADAGGRAIRAGDFAGEQRRHPIAPQRVAHRRAWSDPGDDFVFFFRQHGLAPDFRLVLFRDLDGHANAGWAGTSRGVASPN